MNNKENGFTLIEVMVAIAIVSIISLSLVQLLQTSLQVWNMGTSKMSIYNNLSMSLEYAGENIRKTIPAYNGDIYIPVFLFESSKNIMLKNNSPNNSNNADKFDFVSVTDEDYIYRNYSYYLGDITSFGDDVKTREAYPQNPSEYKSFFFIQKPKNAPIIDEGEINPSKIDLIDLKSNIVVLGYQITSIKYDFCDINNNWIDEWTSDKKYLPKAVKITMSGSDENQIYGDPSQAFEGDSLSMTIRLYQENAPDNWW